MDITDTATGTLKIKRPGMMRWEYQSPDPQVIITDGDKLWIYRPEDKQVMVGEAPSFFKDGKGAGFLSDMKLLRDKFSVFLLTSEMSSNDDYHLKLYPEDPSLDVGVIFLDVDPTTYIIKNIVTYNTYEDETRIRMTDYNFDVEFPDQIFDFSIPEGTDILEME
jgi:outer membrane lipoprotein carrier protein